MLIKTEEFVEDIVTLEGEQWVLEPRCYVPEVTKNANVGAVRRNQEKMCEAVRVRWRKVQQEHLRTLGILERARRVEGDEGGE